MMVKYINVLLALLPIKIVWDNWKEMGQSFGMRLALAVFMVFPLLRMKSVRNVSFCHYAWGHVLSII